MNTPPSLPVANSDDKIWIILCHLSLLIGVGFLLPLVIYLAKKQDAPLTAEHAREALNFHICIYFYAFVSALLCFVMVGIPLLIAVGHPFGLVLHHRRGEIFRRRFLSLSIHPAPRLRGAFT